MNRSHTDIAGPSSRRVPAAHRNEFPVGYSWRVALLHCSLPLRRPESFCNKWRKMQENPTKGKCSPLAFVSMAGFSLRSNILRARVKRLRTLGTSFALKDMQLGTRVGTDWEQVTDTGNISWFCPAISPFQPCGLALAVSFPAERTEATSHAVLIYLRPLRPRLVEAARQRF